MLVKLNYTSDTFFMNGLRILNLIISDTKIVSTSTLRTSLTTSSAHSSITTGLDYANSSVIRITTLTNTISHYSIPTTGYWSCEFTLRQTVYDAPGTYAYIQIYDTAASVTNSSGTAQTYIRIGTTLSSGDMTTGNAPLTVATAASTSAGTPVVLATGGSGYYQYVGMPFNPSTKHQIRCFWFYVTDTCFLYAVTMGTTSPVGFNTTYSNAANYNGPWYFGQYTRYDYHNTNANGVIPYLCTNDRSADGTGFGVTSDWDNPHCITYNTHTAVTAAPFMVYNLVSALPKVGTSWPLISNVGVNWGVGPRYDDAAGLTSSGTNNATRSSSALNPTLFNTVSTRYPSADLTSTAYAMLPILWRASYWGNTGGNTSAQTGVYLFNGDYFPGDEFTSNGITYKIWPVWSGYSNRIGLAVPKQ
jgi:hypothetical protein